LELSAEMLGAPERLAFVPFDHCDEAAFAAILGRTYIGSADCPELSAVRTAAESLAGHRGPGFNPATWWLATENDEPLGVLLINAGDDGGWDLAYLGVVPEARRRGVGGELVRKALVEAKLAEQPFVSLAVDLRNAAARELYRKMGFEPYERRELLLVELVPSPCA
jgi:ribosomal protein S18 acetylase RimI-like enzyme